MKFSEKLNKELTKVISIMKKGIIPEKVKSPPVNIYKDVDLNRLPKYICYKAALLKEKLIFQQIAGILLLMLVIVFSIDRYQINSLHQKLRDKEYIVLPDHIPVSPHTVNDDYIEEAVHEILQNLGNINSSSIDGQYKGLSEMMSLDMRRRFEEEMYEWKEYVKDENITEILMCPKKEIVSYKDGSYEATAACKKETYVNHEYIGVTSEVIQMKLALIPPKKAKRWVIEIKDLARNTKKAFKVKRKIK